MFCLGRLRLIVARARGDCYWRGAFTVRYSQFTIIAPLTPAPEDAFPPPAPWSETGTCREWLQGTAPFASLEHEALSMADAVPSTTNGDAQLMACGGEKVTRDVGLTVDDGGEPYAPAMVDPGEKTRQALSVLASQPSENVRSHCGLVPVERTVARMPSRSCAVLVALGLWKAVRRSLFG